MNATRAPGWRPDSNADLPSDGIAPLECSAVLTHHWLVRPRGGEKVLEALAELVPQAEIHTLVHDPVGMAGSPLLRRSIHTSVLQQIPGSVRHYPKWLALLPWAARRMQLPAVDLVLCSDASIAKAMTPAPRSTVVCYCHSPMRYVYEPEIGAMYRDSLPALLRPIWAPTIALVRRADQRAAARVDVFVANSQNVARRIERDYGRKASVVYPPVDVPAAPSTGAREDYYVCVGYHAPYKRLDLAVDACRRVGRKLVVIGTGPALARIETRRDPHVQFLGWQPDDVIHDHLSRARGLLFPGEEDFGIVPVEAFARGCPVIAYGVGGVTESVVPDVCGVWFEQQTAQALAGAMLRCESVRFDPVRMHAEALRFARTRFLREMRDVLRSALAGTRS